MAAASELAPPPADKPMLVYTRRSARIKDNEAPGRMTILEKASLRKKMKCEGKSLGNPKLLPAAELMALVPEIDGPLPDKDVLQLAGACGLSGLDINVPPRTPMNVNLPHPCRSSQDSDLCLESVYGSSTNFSHRLLWMLPCLSASSPILCTLAILRADAPSSFPFYSTRSSKLTTTM